MGINELMTDFADTTSMHGVPKVIKAPSSIRRGIWSVIWITAFILFSFHTSNLFRHYFANPSKINLKVEPTPVPFPHISICNMRNLDVDIHNELNRLFHLHSDPMSHLEVKHPFIHEYMRIVAKYALFWYRYQDTYPQILQEIFSRTTFSSNIPEDILKLGGIHLQEFIASCFFQGQMCNLTSDFMTFFDPYYFNCFTYNAPLGVHDATSIPEGIENGWSAIVLSGNGMLDINSYISMLPGLHESRSPVSGDEGIRVVIHPQGTQPFPFSEGYDVPPGFSASLGIRPKKNIRTRVCTDHNPFGDSDDSHKVYRVMECQKMCLQQAIIDQCNCSDISLPTLPRMTAQLCRNNDDLPYHCMLNITDDCLESFLALDRKNKCARDTKFNMMKNATKMKNCKCSPPCDEVTYDVTYSLAKWPAAGSEGDAAFFDLFYVEEFKERFWGTPKYNIVDAYFKEETRAKSMQQFTKINVYVSDSNVVTMEESPDYTLTQLMSDIGGNLIIWLGISVITLAEVAELLVSLLGYVLQKRFGVIKEKPSLNGDSGTNA